MRAELPVLYKRQQYAEALPLYKQLKAHAGSVSHRPHGSTDRNHPLGVYKTKNDADVIHAATSLLLKKR